MIEASKFPDLKFPDPPAHCAYAGNIWMEPIVGSGERLTVLLVAVLEDDKALVEYTILPERLARIFGEKAAAIQDMIEIVGGSLVDFLKEPRPLTSWKSPLNGFGFDRLGPVMYDEPIEIFQQLKLCRSCFSCLDCRMPVGAPIQRCKRHPREINGLPGLAEAIGEVESDAV